MSSSIALKRVRSAASLEEEELEEEEEGWEEDDEEGWEESMTVVFAFLEGDSMVLSKVKEGGRWWRVVGEK